MISKDFKLNYNLAMMPNKTNLGIWTNNNNDYLSCYEIKNKCYYIWGNLRGIKYSTYKELKEI